MKFGKYLSENKRPEWQQYYLDYSTLKVCTPRALAWQAGRGSPRFVNRKIE